MFSRASPPPRPSGPSMRAGPISFTAARPQSHVRSPLPTLLLHHRSFASSVSFGPCLVRTVLHPYEHTHELLSAEALSVVSGVFSLCQDRKFAEVISAVSWGFPHPASEAYNATRETCERSSTQDPCGGRPGLIWCDLCRFYRSLLRPCTLLLGPLPTP